LDAQTQRELRVLSQRKRIEVRLQQRARIVLLGVHLISVQKVTVRIASNGAALGR
jgi:hypothetical protein